MCDTLNDTVLESVLVNLPHLVILHIVRCDKVNSISILRFSKHTPLLRSLTMTLVVRIRFQSVETATIQAGSAFGYASTNHPYPPAWTYSGCISHRSIKSRKLCLLHVLFTKVASPIIFTPSEVWSDHTTHIHPGTSWRSRTNSGGPVFLLSAGAHIRYHYLFKLYQSRGACNTFSHPRLC